MPPIISDGVNLAGEEDFSKFAGAISRSTWGNSPFVEVVDMSRGLFRGPRSWRRKVEIWPILTEALDTTAPDGIGTKTILYAVLFALQTGMMRFVAPNLIAMVGGDITRYGGLRLVFSNLLEASVLGPAGSPLNRAFRELFHGLRNVADEQHLVLLNGETAESGACVGSEHPDIEMKFNWAGFMHGVYHPDRMILGDTLRAGQIVIALKERGFRSNGFRSVRAAFNQKFGPRWWQCATPEIQAAVQEAAAPSVIYDALLEDANGWTGNPRILVHGIAHLSGGGIISKFGDDLLRPNGLSARLDNLYDPPYIMERCRDWLDWTHAKSYKNWSGGQGALVVLDETDVPAFQECAAKHGIPSKPCGSIIPTKDRPRLVIQSKYPGGDELVFPLGA